MRSDSVTYLLTRYQSSEVFHCEIHAMKPLLRINVTFLSFMEMGMGMGTVCMRGWIGDGDDLETSCGDRD